MNYHYDGTFEGLLTCVYHHYYTEKATGIYAGDCCQMSMLETLTEVETVPALAERVYGAIRRDFTSQDQIRIYRVFLSGDENKDMALLAYLKLGFATSFDISRLRGNDVVYAFQSLDSKVTREWDKYRGLVRFEYLENGVAYGCIEPDNDILPLLADHFCDRFKEESFILHDRKRNKAVLGRGGKWMMSDMDMVRIGMISEDEKHYSRLWRQYTQDISIGERKNPRCQRTMMPYKYRKYLTEMRVEEIP